MQKTVLCLFFLLLFCNQVIYGQSYQYENMVVEKIDVSVANCGWDTDESEQAVISRMKTRQGHPFSQIDFDSDLKNLSQDFDRIEPRLAIVDQKVVLSLKLWPKPLIRAIRWHGNERLTQSQISSELGIKTCTIFDRMEFNKAFHKVKAFYVKKGFYEAQLEYKANIDPVTNEIDVDIFIEEGRAGKIKDIDFVGFSADEAEDLWELIVTKRYNFFLSWFTQDGVYHEEAIQQDQFTILNYLQNRGYADARVKIDVCEAQQDDRIIITIRADKGPRYCFGPMTVRGNCVIPDVEFWGLFDFTEGLPYSPEQIRATIQAISEIYGRRGYIDACIEYEPRLDPENHLYAIDFIIDEGQQYFVGLIKVFGNCSTQTNVILHETLLIPGQVFNTEKMLKTEERLRNVGFFKTVNVYAVRSDDDPCGLEGRFRDVHIEVEETSTGSFGAFAGYSTVESVFGGISITEKNFNYRGLGCFFNKGWRVLRGGGEYVHLTATVGAKSRRYVFSWTKPYFMDTPWSVGFDLERSNNRYLSKDYDIDASGLTIHATYINNAFLKTAWHYRLRDTHVTVRDSASSLLKSEAENSGLISATGLSLIYDSSDHPATPTCGFKSRVDGEIAGLGGDHSFFSLSYVNSYYIPVGKKGVIKLRGDMRFILPLLDTNVHTLPIDERLFLGGDNTIRGFRPYKLGPKYPEGDPRGGISMQLASAEYSRNIWKRIDGFVFFDAGQLSLDKWHFGRMNLSTGFGFRFQIFEGAPPLTIGMGFPLNARSRGDVKRFFLTVGGKF